MLLDLKQFQEKYSTKYPHNFPDYCTYLHALVITFYCSNTDLMGFINLKERMKVIISC